jgi:hypothetical protein
MPERPPTPAYVLPLDLHSSSAHIPVPFAATVRAPCVGQIYVSNVAH